MGTVTSPARKEIDGATLVRFQMLPLDFKEMITLKNLYLGLKDQLPWKRFFHNFFVSRIDKLIIDMEESSIELVDTLIEIEKIK